MTNTEIKTNLNNIRATLKQEEVRLLESLDRVMGCEMLCERMMNEIDNGPDITFEEVAPDETHQAN